MKNKLKCILLKYRYEYSNFISVLRLTPLCIIAFSCFSVSEIYAYDYEINSKENLSSTIQQTVSGIVKDDTGTPLPGVTVIIKGTSKGTTTDFDGAFTLEANNGDVLEFSYVGFIKQSVTVGPSANYNISLEADNAQLDEVVVVGYGTEKKINLTGSVGTVSSEELNSVPVANSTSLLTGRIPGIVTKQSSGLPGAEGVNISIRGFGTPYILVDGVELEGGFAIIDPSEIENISILKDAAAAVYGSRAANGVVLVTTKRGKSGVPRITYSNSISLQSATSFFEHVNAGKYVELVRESDFNDAAASARNAGNPLPTLSSLESSGGLQFTSEELANYQSGAPGFEGGDWVGDLITNNAPLIKHNITVSGGSENVRYFTSVGLTKQESYFAKRDHDYSRYNVRSNLDVDISKQLSFNLDLSFRHDFRTNAADVNNIFNDLATSQPIYPTKLPDPSQGEAYSGFSERNPIARSSQELFGFTNRYDNTFTGKLGLDYKIPGVEGLTFKTQFNIVSLNRNIKSLRKTYPIVEYNTVDDSYITQAIAGGLSSIAESEFRRNQIFPLVSLEYEKEFGNHYVKGLVLGESRARKFSFLFASRDDLLTTAIPEIFVGNTDFQSTGGSSGSDIGSKSYVGRFDYRYKDRYLFQATFRADGDVLFSPTARWGYFPSFSAGWVISKENFLKSNNTLNYLKLRLSYSETGDARAPNISGYDYLTGYALSGNYLFDGSTNQAIRTLGLVNSDLSWEEAISYNAGIEANFFQNRLQFEADVYFRQRTNLLRPNIAEIPSTFGGNLPLVNLNTENNRGIDIKLNYLQKIGDLKLNISPNFTFTRRKFDKVFDQIEFTDEDQIRISDRRGQWANRNFGYFSDGIFMSQQEIDNHPIDQDAQGNSTLRPGDIRYKDLNGDQEINFRDQDVIAFNSGLPEMIFGLNIGANYKNFSLDMLFQGASRFSVNVSGAARKAFSNSSIPFSYHYDLRWQPDPNNPDVNINPNAQLPAVTSTTSANNNLNSDFWRKDVTFVRLKSFNLSYNLPTELINKAGIKDLQIYTGAENLFTLTNLGIYKNSFDPESAEGNPSRDLPIVRSYSLGLRLTF
ncbi:TonB-dependent receptor [Aureibaculum sp. 2210JD6-5]|uniref:SusC/RagA family TonB-linked outer membrane protein n=1 Tax=Aureibaculum sp. 2210JD6-5 TaxID=3103957 RepID=UPI002AAE8A3F|nr:TonB-dependent receptor [Aureibaculum sp. 2210JD6-5]MDY7395803.1 TonB-dependent receptor [Aureibaculum sp. 2210JD6-5]